MKLTQSEVTVVKNQGIHYYKDLMIDIHKTIKNLETCQQPLYLNILMDTLTLMDLQDLTKLQYDTLRTILKMHLSSMQF